MAMDALVKKVSRFAATRGVEGSIYPTDVAGLSVLYDEQPTRLEAMVYDPVVCLVLQGRKETHIGGRQVQFGAGESLIVSHAVPVVAAVTEASVEKPYLAIVVRLDMSLVRNLEDDFGSGFPSDDIVSPLESAPTDPALIDALERLLACGDDPLEAKALAPLIMQEVHFRLLRARHGGMLRQFLRRDSNASKVSKAITLIKSEYARKITVSEMAKTAGMSNSAFHTHFKNITALSPLQYQKDLRLLAARQLITSEGRTVASAAFAVGYESPTQFSREYTRKFGASPRQHLFLSGSRPVPSGA